MKSDVIFLNNLNNQGNLTPENILNASIIGTPLGKMIAIANQNSLCLLEFLDRKKLEHNIIKLIKITNSLLVPKPTAVTEMVKTELSNYFQGTLKKFTTPLFSIGTNFQQKVWEELQKIDFGLTHSYANVAQRINQPTACRAVAGANSRNRICIIIPCHRIINANGSLGGYSADIYRKEWLLNHEKQYIDSNI